eukprot:CAMPEP_0177652452 /NCGR_PEP_ID=MMETSP0447-20121125/13141_1 /TAXON_ID=0 /ORGANISM="Stygamoeba regulata, Strain BSH-02190019" /LENGTH=690 /DNA_ID=CAMNT_0019155705 /DNA_START=27 /DNA_END=2099 /DNA_ORIENTATION=-
MDPSIAAYLAAYGSQLDPQQLAYIQQHYGGGAQAHPAQPAHPSQHHAQAQAHHAPQAASQASSYGGGAHGHYGASAGGMGGGGGGAGRGSTDQQYLLQQYAAALQQQQEFMRQQQAQQARLQKQLQDQEKLLQQQAMQKQVEAQRQRQLEMQLQQQIMQREQMQRQMMMGRGMIPPVPPGVPVVGMPGRGLIHPPGRGFPPPMLLGRGYPRFQQPAIQHALNARKNFCQQVLIALSVQSVKFWKSLGISESTSDKDSLSCARLVFYVFSWIQKEKILAATDFEGWDADTKDKPQHKEAKSADSTADAAGDSGAQEKVADGNAEDAQAAEAKAEDAQAAEAKAEGAPAAAEAKAEGDAKAPAPAAGRGPLLHPAAVAAVAAPANPVLDKKAKVAPRDFSAAINALREGDSVFVTLTEESGASHHMVLVCWDGRIYIAQSWDDLHTLRHRYYLKSTFLGDWNMVFEGDYKTKLAEAFAEPEVLPGATPAADSGKGDGQQESAVGEAAGEAASAKEEPSAQKEAEACEKKEDAAQEKEGAGEVQANGEAAGEAADDKASDDASKSAAAPAKQPVLPACDPRKHCYRRVFASDAKEPKVFVSVDYVRSCFVFDESQRRFFELTRAAGGHGSKRKSEAGESDDPKKAKTEEPSAPSTMEDEQPLQPPAEGQGQEGPSQVSEQEEAGAPETDAEGK